LAIFRSLIQEWAASLAATVSQIGDMERAPRDWERFRRVDQAIVQSRLSARFHADDLDFKATWILGEPSITVVLVPPEWATNLPHGWASPPITSLIVLGHVLKELDEWR
jgi:hypothetical protein